MTQFQKAIPLSANSTLRRLWIFYAVSSDATFNMEEVLPQHGFERRAKAEDWALLICIQPQKFYFRKMPSVSDAPKAEPFKCKKKFRRVEWTLLKLFQFFIDRTWKLPRTPFHSQSEILFFGKTNLFGSKAICQSISWMTSFASALRRVGSNKLERTFDAEVLIPNHIKKWHWHRHFKSVGILGPERCFYCGGELFSRKFSQTSSLKVEKAVWRKFLWSFLFN